MESIELKNKILTCAQFPPKERAQPYQSYYLKDEGYVQGSRDTLYRYDKMGISNNLMGKSVLDMGSQLGAMSIEAYRRGANTVLGLEYDNDFLSCAKELTEYNNMNITYKHANLMDLNSTVDTIHTFFGKENKVDIVFALSLTKHVGVINLYKILRNFRWDVCYIEGHNSNGTLETDHCKDIINNLVRHFHNTFLGYTEDRSIRPVWRLEQVCVSR